MAELFKLVMSASAPTTTTTPATAKYFYKLTTAFTAASGTPSLSITATTMTDDTGAAVTTSITRATSNGYYQLFINGVLQQSAIFTVSADGSTLTITPPTGSTIGVGNVVVLTVTNFTSDTTAPTISG